MSRFTAQKFEKTKVKVVFRLQFHATHIPQTGWDKLFISFIPIDSVKLTTKTTKANVRNGTCKWADPIYETTRLLQDAKSKQYDDKLYKLLVAMGSSRPSILGEATINLSDYADVLKPSVILLPLQGCNSGAILHVTVQLLTSKTGFREFEQQRELSERRMLTGNYLNKYDESGAIKVTNSEEIVSDQMDKVNGRVTFRPEFKNLPSLEEEVDLTDQYSDSAPGFDGSSNVSESLYAEKHDAFCTKEIENLKHMVSGELNGLLNCHSPCTEKGELSDLQTLAQERRWGSDYSVNNDMEITREENIRLRGTLEHTESSILKLKLEVSSLQRYVDEIGMQTQNFTHQIAAEIASSEELAKQVCLLKSECSNFKGDLVRLVSLKLNPRVSSQETNHAEHDHLLQPMQLRWVKGIIVLEDKIRKLQKKAYLGFHEKESGLLCPEFEALLITLQNLKQETVEAMSLPSALPSGRTNVNECSEFNEQKDGEFLSLNNYSSTGNNFDVDLYQPDCMLQFLGLPSLVSQEPESSRIIDAVKSKIFELLRELDDARVERESLVRRMNQMECYYEALVQELEENQRQMVGELQILRNEHSTCLYVLSSNKVEIESMRQDMNQQIIRCTQEKHDLDIINKDLERRAMTSDAALRRARLNYSIAVDQLQRDIELLSSQVISMFENNEKLIKQAFLEQHYTAVYLQSVQKTRESDSIKPFQRNNENYVIQKQQFCGDICLEDLNRSLCLKEELYQNVKEELCEMHYVNLSLDLFSLTLQETLHDSKAGLIFMKGELDEVANKLEVLIESKDQLTGKLHIVLNDLYTLNEEKVSCIAKCNNMVVQNQLLEEKFEVAYKENCLLMQKIAECKELMKEYSSYECKYVACSAENSQLAILLEQESLKNNKLQSEISSLEAELKMYEAGLDDLASSKENLQKTSDFICYKLSSLLSSYENQFSGLNLVSNFPVKHFQLEDSEDIILHLEEIQHNACKKILQLMEEKKDLESEKDVAEVSMSTAQSEICVAKQMLTNDIEGIVSKLDVSNALVEKLQLKLDSVSNKLQISSEVEEKYALKSKGLVAELASLELELQKLGSQNGDFTDCILDFEALTEAVGKSKLKIYDLSQEKQNLIISLQNENDRSVQLESETASLRESMTCLHNELHAERSLRDNLEVSIAYLNAQLKEKHDILHIFDQQQADLAYFRQLASDLELEKSRACHLWPKHEECMKKFQEDCSWFTVPEIYLTEMQELLIAQDVQVTFLKTRYQSLIEQLVKQLQFSDGHLIVLQKRLLDLEAILKCSLKSRSHYIKENSELDSDMKSLKIELEYSLSQNRSLLDLSDALKIQLEEYKMRLAKAEFNCSENEKQNALVRKQLNQVVAGLEEEIFSLIISQEELEIMMVALKAKLNEQYTSMTILEECNDELVMLRKQSSEVRHKLSEQILRTEEFKNLTIHLKELKDKADAECRLAHEKREPEGRPVAMQESLRIAFIKEQYETKLQELRQHLSISRKHGEDILWKLQDAIDEIENRKKSEASHLKKNEELSVKIMALDCELLSLLSDKREKIKAYDRMKAELECALLSLECCREEKQKLEATLQECDLERSRIAVELACIKEQLQNSASHVLSNEINVGMAYLENLNADSHSHETRTREIVEDDSTRNSFHRPMNKDSSVNDEVEDARLNLIDGEELSSGPVSVQPVQWERMKSDNSIHPEDHPLDPDFQGLRKEFEQLHKVNAELETMYPSLNQVSSSGNALGKVLTLEIELAGSLREKNKPSIHFQSSFMKLHEDEEAVLRSFKDINELIKYMLKLKGRYASVENELKEMQSRYSQLSLQFAEVEGERQKLVMTLKNVHTPRKLMHLSSSSSATLENHPS